MGRGQAPAMKFADAVRSGFALVAGIAAAIAYREQFDPAALDA